MYWLSRVQLKIAALLLMFTCLSSVVVCWPYSVVFVLVALIRWSGGRVKALTSYGSASWADSDELRRHRMVGRQQGILLGRMYEPKCLSKTLDRALRSRDSSIEVCESIFGTQRNRSEVLVSLWQAVSLLVFAPTGAGKGVSFVLPFLFNCWKDSSAVVVDFKGENARLTSHHRRRKGHRIVMLDPYNMVTSAPDSFNPLDFIDKNGDHMLDQCQALAKALVIRAPDEREPHWNDAAELVITAVVAFVVAYGEAMDQNLQSVVEIISDPEKFETACKAMRESKLYGGMLSRLGHQLRNFQGKELASVITTSLRHLRFLNTPVVAANTCRSTFDASELRSRQMTVYLILPPQHMRSMAGLLRMWITSLFTVIISKGLGEDHLVHFVLDEAAAMGRMEAIEDAAVAYRGYGVRFQFYFQSVGQLKTVFPNGQDQTILSNASQTFFGVNDTATAELVSQRLGESTIVVDSGGRNESTSRQWGGDSPRDIVNYSTSTNANWQQHGRRLLKPEEVLTLHPRSAITFTPGVRPIFTKLLRYYEEPWLQKSLVMHQWSLSGLLMLVRSSICLVAVAGGMILVFAVLDALHRSKLIDPNILSFDSIFL